MSEGRKLRRRLTGFGVALTLVLAGLLLLGPVTAQAQPAFVTGQSAYNSVTFTNTVSVTLPGPSTTGNLIVLSFNINTPGSLTVTSVTDNKGNSYSAAAAPLTWNGTSERLWTYYASNITGGGAAVTVTITLSGVTPFLEGYLLEYSGVAKTSPVDQTSSGFGSGTVLSSGSQTTTSPSELIYGVCFDYGIPTVDPPFTARDTSNNNFVADRTVSATGSYAVTGSMPVGAAWGCQMVTFKAQAPAATSQMRVLSGSYPGDGTDDRAIYVGFRPDVVIVDMDDTVTMAPDEAVIRTSTMVGDFSKDMDGPNLPAANKIQSLTATGFTIGTDATVNEATRTYHWVAFRAAPGNLTVGSYPGDGVTDDRSITGVGFQPEYVILMSGGATQVVQRSSVMPGDITHQFDSTGFANGIQALQADGFQVGLDPRVNAAATTYYYAAWNATPGEVAVGVYTGDGATSRNIAGVGFLPEWAHVTRSGSSFRSTHKPASTGVGTDRSLLFESRLGEADNIQALQPDGFQVGGHSRVNSNTAPNNYYWAAFGPHTPRTNYRSIGTAAAYGTGTVSVTNGSSTVTGAGGPAWQNPANRGRGDVITIPCNDPPACLNGAAPDGVHYAVYYVGSQTSLLLTQGYAGATAAGLTYLLRRQFTTLAAWEDCIDGPPGTACPFFPVVSASLVADDRSEVGIAYDDQTPSFLLTSSVQIQGSTTDPFHTIRLTADPGNRHNGVPGAGVVVDANLAGNEFDIRDANVTVEWLEFVRARGDNIAAVQVYSTDGDLAQNVVLQNLLVHDFGDKVAAGLSSSGIDLAGTNTLAGKSMIVRNTMIWDGDEYAIEGDGPLDTALIENVSVGGMAFRGIYASGGPFTVRNTISVGNPSGDFAPGSGGLSGSNNTSTDGSANFGTNPQVGVTALLTYVTPNVNLHLRAGALALDTALDLSASFTNDIDGQLRPAGVAFDRGADEFGATTAVELLSFEARALDSAVELVWRTASELHNLGFHLYRSPSASGPFERITSSLIPGLGSSPTGASYSYRDGGLQNGQTYYYELEDWETTGSTKRHGPVSATPLVGSGGGEDQDGSDDPGGGDGDVGSGGDSHGRGAARITYGQPEATSFRVLERGARHVVLELVTPGFYGVPEEDGSVRLEIPGFESRSVPGAPAVPVLRTFVEAVAGRRVRLSSVVAREEVRFDGLRVATAEGPGIVVTESGMVRAGRQRAKATARPSGLFPRSWAQVLGAAFQGETKKAQVELSPLRHDTRTGTTFLAGRLVVRLEFEGVERGERGSGGSRGRRSRPSPAPRRNGQVAELVTKEAGLHGVRFEDVLPGRRAVPSSSLRLSYQGQAVPFHLEPAGRPFGPGSVLYFVSEGAASNPWGDAVYALETGRAGVVMPTLSGSPSGPATLQYLDAKEWEQNRFYQAGLLEAKDLWQWDLLVSPVTKSYPFALSQLSPSSTAARLTVWVQGASDFEADPDHHLTVLVNGTPVGEASWDGQTETVIEAEVSPGLLQEGANTLSVENVGDTSAAYSMVFLNRFALHYPRLLVAENGRIQGSFGESGGAEVSGLGPTAFVVDTQEGPKWLSGLLPTTAGVSFRAEAGRSYLAVSASAVKTPLVRQPVSSRLRSPSNRAEWVLIGPKEFLPVARPLIDLRRGQGLQVKVVSMEEIAQEFGYGESRPEALKAFLEYAYESWRRPSLRYVVLLGDGSYDPKDYLQTGVKDRIPPYIVKTSYLWTASDPLYGAVNGEDLLPDVAVGRMSAGTVEEARILVEKVVAFETGGRSLDGRAVLIADNADLAGSFEADADEIAASVLSQREVEKVYLRDLQGGTRATIVAAFDNGPGLVSYMGHGGTAVWASENVFNNTDVAALSAQGQQPLLLTMNCLNGFFHFPPLNSLAEAFVKAEGKGAVAAFSPSGLSLNDAAHVYHQAVLREIESGRHSRLGDAILAAQSAYADSGAFPELLSIYHLLGDPALRIR